MMISLQKVLKRSTLNAKPLNPDPQSLNPKPLKPQSPRGLIPIPYINPKHLMPHSPRGLNVKHKVRFSSSSQDLDAKHKASH